LLRGGRPLEAERASTLPSSNALRPDSNLNLGWYRPATPEAKPHDSGDGDAWTSYDEPRETDEPQSLVAAGAISVDLYPNPSASDPSDSPLGARGPRSTPAESSHETRRREIRLARVGVVDLRRLVVVRLWPGVRELRRRTVAAGVASVLLVAAATAAVTGLQQPGNQHRVAAHAVAGLRANQLGGAFLSSVTSRLTALSESEFEVGSRVQRHSGSHAHRQAQASRARGGQRDRTRAARISMSSGRSTPMSHATDTSRYVSQGTSGVGSDSGTTAASEAPAETTPVQQTLARRTSTQGPVHHQPTAQPPGPAGLGSQVGGNCNPKCS
jgi:hypothetical protein